jgi:aminopeptidase N
LDGDVKLNGIVVEKGLIWNLLCGLVIVGEASREEIEEAYENDKTADGYESRFRALATIPTKEAKRKVLEYVINTKNITNTFILWSSVGWGFVNDSTLLEDLVDTYFANIRYMWENRSFHIAELYVSRFYPRPVKNQALLDAGNKWLEENKDAPNALRRLVEENIDETVRDLRNELI